MADSPVSTHDPKEGGSDSQDSPTPSTAEANGKRLCKHEKENGYARNWPENKAQNNGLVR